MLSRRDEKSNKFFTVLLTVLLLAFVGFTFFINLSCNPEYYDGDILCDINYAKEAWESKSFFPSNWVFGNQTYVAATPNLAALIYGITGNAVTAMAIASCIMTVLTILSYDWMTRTVFSYNERTAGGLLVAAFLLIKNHPAISRGGMQFFFTMASYYSCYLITAFIVYGCYIRIRTGKFKKLHIPLLIFGAVLSFATGMQSLRQTTVMALPLVACEIVLIIIYSVKNKKTALSKSTAFAALIFVSNIAGYLAMKLIDINQYSIYGDIRFNSFGGFINKVWVNIFALLNTLAVEAFPKAVKFALAGVIFLAIIAAAVFCIKSFFKSAEQEQGDFVLMMLLMLGCLSVFAAETLLNIIDYSHYYFMIYPLTGFCTAYMLKKIKKGQAVLYSVISILAAGLIAFGFVGVSREIRLGRDRQSAAYSIADYMMDNGYDTLYSEFGMYGKNTEGEGVFVASAGRIYLIHFQSRNGTIESVPFLHVENDSVKRDNEKSLYLLKKDNLNKATEIADKHGVKMTLVKKFDGGIYLYSMSENLYELFEPYKN